MEKEKVFEEFKEIMVKNSWTYNRMTTEEQNNFLEHLNWERTQKIVKGTYTQRWKILNELYYYYLLGLGYDGCDWRGK